MLRWLIAVIITAGAFAGLFFFRLEISEFLAEQAHEYRRTEYVGTGLEWASWLVRLYWWGIASVVSSLAFGWAGWRNRVARRRREREDD